MSDQAAPNYSEGTICHIEIPAPDLNKAKEFYSSVFGWQVNEIPGMDYLMFMAGPVGGGFDPAANVVESSGPNIILYAGDIDAKLKDVESAGGSILKGKTLIAPGIGYTAQFRDNNGNTMGLYCKD